MGSGRGPRFTRRTVHVQCSFNPTVIKCNFNRIFAGPLRKAAEIFVVHTLITVFPQYQIEKINVLALQIKQYLLSTELTNEQFHQALINFLITNKIMWYVCNNTNDHLDNNTAIKVFENELLFITRHELHFTTLINY